MIIRSVVFGIWLVGASMVTMGCAVQHVQGAKARAIPLSQLKNGEAATLKAWAEGKEDNFIVAVKKGQSIPLNIKGDVGFAKIEAGENAVVFTQDVYLFISRTQGLLLSPDGERFAPVHKVRALKKLFGKEHGTVSVGLGVTKTDGAFVNLAAGLQ